MRRALAPAIVVLGITATACWTGVDALPLSAFPPSPYSPKGCVADEQFLVRSLDAYRSAVDAANRQGRTQSETLALIAKLKSIRGKLAARQMGPDSNRARLEMLSGLDEVIGGEQEALGGVHYQAGVALIDKGYKEVQAAFWANAATNCRGA